MGSDQILTAGKYAQFIVSLDARRVRTALRKIEPAQSQAVIRQYMNGA